MSTWIGAVAGVLSALIALLGWAEHSQWLPGWLKLLSGFPFDFVIKLLLSVLFILGFLKLRALEIQLGNLRSLTPIVNHDEPLKLIQASPEPDPGATYKMKLRAILRNDSRTTIRVFSPIWKPRPGGVQAQVPHAARLQLEADNGWDQERNDVQVLPGKRFQAWIGLDQNLGIRDFQERHEVLQLGALEFQVREDGRDIVQTFLV
jgi:hypothetical protein